MPIGIEFERIQGGQNGFNSFHQIAIGHFEEFHPNVEENYFIHFVNFAVVSLTLIDSYYIK